MHAPGILAGRKQPLKPGRAIEPEHDAAHHVVGRRDHLDAPARKIEAAVGAALDHAFEFLAHALGAEMVHLQIDPAKRRRVPFSDLVEDGAAHHVAGRAFAARIVVGHEAASVAIEKPAAGAAQALLEHGAGHPRVGSRQQAGGMELHHFHIA